MTYEAKQFDLPELKGLSAKQIEVHLGLYGGYVKHVNLIGEKLAAVRDGSLELDPYIVAELRRRFAFEFDGARMHEHYFEQLEGGASGADASGKLAALASAKYGAGIESLIAHIKEVAGSRGIGWVVVYYDNARDTIVTSFVTDHEVGQLAGLPILFALDLWEHAFMVDYVPAEKKNYVDAFFDNLNWTVVEKRLAAVLA